MKALFILVATLIIGTNAFADNLTQLEKRQACTQVRGMIPTENGYGISQKSCLETFEFEILDKTGSITVISMSGQTVEDMATVCTVYLLSDPTIEIAVPAPTCSLE